MALKTKSIRGTRDVVPSQSHRWHYIERVALEVAQTYGIRELRIPTIEKTELFVRSVGESTDVVQKEMYTFDKGRESITLRPEGTAGLMRAVLENNLHTEALPVKASYVISCFRHENPQAGRLREFHQFGIEYYGSSEPAADAEVIGVAHDYFLRLGLTGVVLEINSIGCPKCRPDYNRLLVEYYRSHSDSLCDTCKQRLETNPLRLLDCKNDTCAALAKDAPLITSHLCEECADHFSSLQILLRAMGIDFTVNPLIVRGLDYYTKTVFEFVSGEIGAQSTVCGGGRYDLLSEELGGPPLPALGFALGLERLLMLMEAQNCAFPEPAQCDLYLGGMGENERHRALELASVLRREGFMVECDLAGRSVKAQMKYANRLPARYACIIGETELLDSAAKIKHMETGAEERVALNGQAFSDYLYAGLSDPDRFRLNTEKE